MSGYSLGDTSVKTTLKYGLNPAAKKKGPAGKAKKGPLKPALAAFAEDSDDDDAKDEREPVSYTHLTLPTILRV